MNITQNKHRAITHDEAYSISNYLTVRNGKKKKKRNKNKTKKIKIK